MKILRVNDDHYLVDTRDQAGRYALILLNKRLTIGAVPADMRDFATTVCAGEDGPTALALLAQLDDVTIIPTKVL